MWRKAKVCECVIRWKCATKLQFPNLLLIRLTWVYHWWMWETRGEEGSERKTGGAEEEEGWYINVDGRFEFQGFGHPVPSSGTFFDEIQIHKKSCTNEVLYTETKSTQNGRAWSAWERAEDCKWVKLTMWNDRERPFHEIAVCLVLYFYWCTTIVSEMYCSSTVPVCRNSPTPRTRLWITFITVIRVLYLVFIIVKTSEQNSAVFFFVLFFR